MPPFSSTTVVLKFLETKLPRRSRPPATPSRATGPDFSPRLSRARTSLPSSPTFPDPLHPPEALLPHPPPPPLLKKRPLPRKRSPKKKRPTWTWVVSSAMTTTESSQTQIRKTVDIVNLLMTRSIPQSAAKAEEKLQGSIQIGVLCEIFLSTPINIVYLP